MIKAVIFDVGGVLHNERTFAIQADIAAYFGVDRERVQRAWEKLTPVLGRGEITEAEFWKQFQQELGVAKILTGESLLGRKLRDGFRPSEEVLAYAHELKKRGLKIGALSNTVSPHYGIVRGSGILKGFDDVVLSFEVGLRKPDPAIYRLALERLGVEAHEAVYVDDAAMNVEAAEAVGMHGIVFENAAQLRTDLERALAKQ